MKTGSDSSSSLSKKSDKATNQTTNSGLCETSENSSRQPTTPIPGCRYIPLGELKFAIVDADLYDSLMKYKWHAVRYRRSWYARTIIGSPGHQYFLSMHRLIARTPRLMVCHHDNENSLDNRKANLFNWTKTKHTNYHRNNPRKTKFAEISSENVQYYNNEYHDP